MIHKGTTIKFSKVLPCWLQTQVHFQDSKQSLNSHKKTNQGMDQITNSQNYYLQSRNLHPVLLKNGEYEMVKKDF